MAARDPASHDPGGEGAEGSDQRNRRDQSGSPPGPDRGLDVQNTGLDDDPSAPTG